jgi:hypothetical protein
MVVGERHRILRISGPLCRARRANDAKMTEQSRRRAHRREWWKASHTAAEVFARVRHRSRRREQLSFRCFLARAGAPHLRPIGRSMSSCPVPPSRFPGIHACRRLNRQIPRLPACPRAHKVCRHADNDQPARRADKCVDFKQLDHMMPRPICSKISGSIAMRDTRSVLLFKNSRILFIPFWSAASFSSRRMQGSAS